MAAADPVAPLPLIGVSAFLDRTEYLANRDFLGLALQTVAAAGAAGRDDQSRPTEHGEQLLEVGERNLLSFSNFG